MTSVRAHAPDLLVGLPPVTPAGAGARHGDRLDPASGADLGPAPVDDPSLDRLARLVRRALGVPVALVSLVEADRQVFPGAEHLPKPWRGARQTPLTHSICQYVVADQQPLIVSDARDTARTDPRLRGDRAISELGIVAYAGWPLLNGRGRVIGSLSAIDSRPRMWTAADLDLLEDLASVCSAELQQRDQVRMATTGQGVADELSDRSAVLLALCEGLLTTQTLADVAAAVGATSREYLGCLRAELWSRDVAWSDPASDLPASDLPASEGGGESLHHVVDPGQARPGVAMLRSLPLAPGHPLADVSLSGAPRFFRDRADQDRAYPDLADPCRTSGSRVFVPLGVGGEQYGALELVWAEARDHSEEDRVTLAAWTTYVSWAVHRALLLRERTDALVTLQAAMLTELPQPADLQLAARYLPAGGHDQVGGDWYDAVTLPSGATMLTIGDVVGHDMGAAAIMGQVRSMLRALAWTHDDLPSASVARLDRAVDELRVEALATLVFARIEQTEEQRPDGVRRVCWTNAGHPAPLLIGPDGAVRYLDESTPDLMLGVVPDTVRTDQHVEVAPGSTLVLFTDGLVERRGESISVGLERLAAAARTHADLPAPALLDALLGDLVDAHPPDDVAMTAVRFLPPS